LCNHFYVTYSSLGVSIGSGGSERSQKSFGPNQWIHVQLAFDWVAEEAHILISSADSAGVESTPVDGGTPWLKPTSFARIDLFAAELTGYNGPVYFDEIELFP
jgi:hypothetical protein